MRNRTLSLPGADSEARRVPRVRVICTQARPGGRFQDAGYAQTGPPGRADVVLPLALRLLLVCVLRAFCSSCSNFSAPVASLSGPASLTRGVQEGAACIDGVGVPTLDH